jgi:chromosome segregation ATPase
MIPLVVIAVATGKVAVTGLAGYGTYILGRQGYHYYYPNNEPNPIQTDNPTDADNPIVARNIIMIDRADSIHSDLSDATTTINTQQIQNWIEMGKSIELLKNSANQSAETTTQLNELMRAWIELSHAITTDVQTMQQHTQYLQSRLIETVNTLATTQINLANQEQQFQETINALQNQCTQLTNETRAAHEHIKQLSLTHEETCHRLNMRYEEQITDLNKQIKTLSQANEQLVTILSEVMQKNNEQTHLASSPDSIAQSQSNTTRTRFF